MSVRIDIAERIVVTVLVLIKRLRGSQICIKRWIGRCVSDKIIEFIRTACELIRTREPPLRRGVIPGKEVIESRLIIPFLEG